MNKLIKSILKTAVYFLDQTDRFASDARDRVADGLDSAAGRMTDLRDRVQDLTVQEDHTLRNALTFAAGVGVGVGAAILFTPASGEQIRSQKECLGAVWRNAEERSEIPPCAIPVGNVDVTHG